MDSTLLPFALLCFTSFFTLTNPLGTMPVFTMTQVATDGETSVYRTSRHHCVVYYNNGICLLSSFF